MRRKRIFTVVISVLILLTATTEYVSAREEALQIPQENSEDDGNTVNFRARIHNRSVGDGFSYPDVTDLVKVYTVQFPLVERDQRREPAPDPDHSIGDLFQVGDVQWRVLTAQYLGHEAHRIRGKGDSLFTDERFVLVRFEFLNRGSDPVEFDGESRNRQGVLLVDSQGREYPYFLVHRRGRRDTPPENHIPEDEDCYGYWRFEQWWRPYILKPNISTTCSVIYEVNVDATGLVLKADDLDDDRVSATQAVGLGLRPIYRRSVGDRVRVGDVRWQVLSAQGIDHVLETVVDGVKIKDRLLRIQFEVKNEGSDSLDFDVVDDVRLRDEQGREHQHYLVPRKGLPDRYPSEHIPDNEECIRLKMKPSKSATCTGIYEVPADATGLILIANDLKGREDGAEIVRLPDDIIDPPDLPVGGNETPPGVGGEEAPDWQAIKDCRLGYSLAVPDGWHIIDLQKVEQHPLWSMFKRLFADEAVVLKEFIDSPAGENIGYLTLEIDMFPRPTVKSTALVATVPLADDIPSESVTEMIKIALQSFDEFPVDVRSLVSGTTNNYSSIQGVASVDLRDHGLYAAYAVFTALRANDTAYILVVLTPAKDVLTPARDAEVKQQQIEQIVGTFRPEACKE